MNRRQICQERFGFGECHGVRRPSLDELAGLIDDRHLADIPSVAKGEPVWPPLALFKAMLLVVWYDLSDVKLAEALDDRVSFRLFCGFSASESTPEHMALVRFRKALVARGLDQVLSEEAPRQLKVKEIRVKAGTLADVTIIVSAREDDGEAHWVKHKGKPVVHGFKLMSAPRPPWARKSLSPRLMSITARLAWAHCWTTRRRFLPTERLSLPAFWRYRSRQGWHVRIVTTGMWGRDGSATVPGEPAESTACASGSKRSWGYGNVHTVCSECAGELSPKPPYRSASSPSSTTSSTRRPSSRGGLWPYGPRNQLTPKSNQKPEKQAPWSMNRARDQQNQYRNLPTRRSPNDRKQNIWKPLDSIKFGGVSPF